MQIASEIFIVWELWFFRQSAGYSTWLSFLIADLICGGV